MKLQAEKVTFLDARDMFDAHIEKRPDVDIYLATDADFVKDPAFKEECVLVLAEKTGRLTEDQQLMLDPFQTAPGVDASPQRRHETHAFSPPPCNAASTPEDYPVSDAEPALLEPQHCHQGGERPVSERNMPRGGRPRVKGFEASPSQHKRASVSVLRKIVINSYVERNGIAAAVDRFYPSLHSTDRKLKKRQLHEWYEDRADIADQVARGNGHLNKMPRNGIGCVLPRDAEDRLAFWVRDLRREGVPVSPLMLQIKARTLATTIGLNRSQFAASCSWRRRFLKTYRLSLRRRTRIGQRTPDDARQVAEAFSKKVNDLMLKHGITEVCNANQTALNFEHLSTQTIDETGTRTVWVRNCGKEKARFTAMLLADSRGFQRAPFLVFKQPASRVKATESYKRAEQNGFGRDLWKKVRNMQASTGMTIYCNSRGWWNAELSVEFLKSHFAKRANPDVPILLIWDEFSGHWTAEVESCAKDLNVLLVKVPGGYTSVCQPADIAGMRPLKLKLRDQWLGDIERQFQQYQGKQEKFVLQPPIRETVVGWLHASWSRLSRATIVGGFRKIGVASDLREPPEEEPAAFENKLQEVLKTLESCSAAFDVSKEAE